ncbi:MAG: hypothetical protein K2N38_04630 [Oscillospiraceae bacterium]|nr:hypothetical protein [Oscillospiraceae bacterium]
MKITVDRDSVCAGDDIFPHKKTYELPDNADCRDLLAVLKADGFFASVSGNDVVWALTVGSTVFAYFTKSGRCVSRGGIRLSALGHSTLKFTYYTSPDAWEKAHNRRTK